ncbi:MAG: hypothetical protein IPF57_24710 [Gammaproteobacteria bacterium]|nr:hypothetical protein [Gammaproteobacteria bacterium]
MSSSLTSSPPEEVPDAAVAALHGGGEAHRHVFAERGVADALDVAAVVIAAGDLMRPSVANAGRW